MKMIRRLILWAPALTLLSMAGSGEVSALVVSNARQITFEEVATQAKVIVLGRLTEIPEMAVFDRATRQVYRHNRVQVAEYLKGAGAPAIEVLTLGGNFDTDGLGLNGPRVQFIEYGGGEPQLPPVGTEVLLFLKPSAGGEAFIVCSHRHGIIRVEEAEKGQEPYVTLLFSYPDLASPAAAARARAMNHPDTFESIVIVDRVPLGALKATIDKVLNLKR